LIQFVAQAFEKYAHGAVSFIRHRQV
jgi:hypothetical protein